MFCIALVSVYALIQSTIPVAGQCTVSKCQVSDSESEESLMTKLGDHDEKMHNKIQRMNETLSSAIEKLNQLFNQVNQDFQCARTRDVCDCSHIKANGYTTNGVYRIYVDHEGKRHYANTYCDMMTTNGPWTVFQRRKDGSVDFYREWIDYDHGFGNPYGEFWLGNNFLQLLTLKRRYRLRIDLESFEGGMRHAKYSSFSISSSADKYRLRIGGYSGTAGDSLSGQNGNQFTTKDSDNDALSSGNCAIDRRGAWWYDSCTWSNLNGLYLRGRYSSINGSFNGMEGIIWDGWHGAWHSLKKTEMKIASS